jgi:hypothetical protein
VVRPVSGTPSTHQTRVQGHSDNQLTRSLNPDIIVDIVVKSAILTPQRGVGQAVAGSFHMAMQVCQVDIQYSAS